jgi:hypothetical protein
VDSALKIQFSTLYKCCADPKISVAKALLSQGGRWMTILQKNFWSHGDARVDRNARSVKECTVGRREGKDILGTGEKWEVYNKIII